MNNRSKYPSVSGESLFFDDRVSNYAGSNLFNFSRILGESAYTDIVRSVSNRTYLSTGIGIMREADLNINSLNKTLYTSLLESDNVKDENECFGKFFRDYRKVIVEFKNKMNTLASQFTINVETFVDANRDILDVDKLECKSGVTFNGIKYTNLLSDDIPNVNPYKAFKKEFAFIGKLMQDLDPIAPEDAKSKIIATVYNSLVKEITDGWLDKVVAKISDNEEAAKDEFAKAMFDKFVEGPMSMTLDIATVEQARLSLKNYGSYTTCIGNAVEHFCEGLDQVADEIGSMFFRNKDHKLPIKTDVEGVEDKTYRLDDYSFNQMNIFTSTKISQITELCNLYIIAMTIKMDCIYKYLQQCKAIVDASCCDSTPDIDTTGLSDKTATSPECEEPAVTGDEDTGEQPADQESDEEPEQEPEAEEETPAEPEEETPAEPEDNLDTPDETPKEETPVEPETDDSTEGEEVPEEKPEAEEAPVEPEETPAEPEEPETEDPKVEEPASESATFNEGCYLFEAELFQLERYYNNAEVLSAFTEADEEVPATATDTSPVSSIIDKLNRLLDRFKDTITKTYAADIKYISDNKQAILDAEIPSGWTIQRYDMKTLNEIDCPKFELKDVELLKDTNKYLDDKYGKYIAPAVGSEDTIKDRIINKLFDKKENKYTDNDKKEGLDYVTTEYAKTYSRVEKMCNTLASFSKSVSSDSEVQKEAAMDEAEAMRLYFTEDSTETTKKDKENNAKKNPETLSDTAKQTAYRAYADINSRVIVCIMNIYTNNMKKQLNFLKRLAQLNSTPEPSDKGKATVPNNQVNQQER
jgi:outer membrane biosynthesis protein TonB